MIRDEELEIRKESVSIKREMIKYIRYVEKKLHTDQRYQTEQSNEQKHTTKTKLTYNI